MRAGLKGRMAFCFAISHVNRGEGRNRPDFPAVALQICLISLGIQAKTVLSDRIVFNPFGVRFGVRYNYFSARR
jgi:hypothetical protein